MARRIFFLVAALLLLSQAAYAYCPTAERTINIVAVVGEQDGGLFQLIAKVQPGSGNIYSSIIPRVGTSTQDSEHAAAEYAFTSTGFDRSGCDVLFSMKGSFGGSTVDGPSAGSAMAIALRAALLNKTIRQDAAITGTVDGEGRIGAVGGVIEKSFGAADRGVRYLLVPSLQVYEALMVSKIGPGFQAIEVKNVTDAERILYSQIGSFNSTFRPENRPVPAGLPATPVDADLGRFSIVATRMVSQLDEKVKSALGGAGPKEGEQKVLADYFSSEVQKYRSLLPLGYPYTSANSAFLMMVDVEYARLGGAQVDLDSKARQVQSCVDGLSLQGKNSANFMWAAGADLRMVWARTKLNQTLEARPQREGYATLRDLLFAEEWCMVSRHLAEQASDLQGKGYDEPALVGLASEKLSGAEKFVLNRTNPDSDALWHLQNAIEANRSGLFLAAILDATYARSMQEAAIDGVNDNTTAGVKRMLSVQPVSLWGKIYYGQGKYAYYDAAANNLSMFDSYRVLKYAEALDGVDGEIAASYAKASQAPKAVQQEPQGGQELPVKDGGSTLLPALVMALVALAGLCAIFWRDGRAQKKGRRKRRR